MGPSGPSVDDLQLRNEELARRIVQLNRRLGGTGIEVEPGIPGNGFFAAMVSSLPGTLVVVYNQRLRMAMVTGDPRVADRSGFDGLLANPLSTLLPDRAASLRLQEHARHGLSGRAGEIELVAGERAWLARWAPIGRQRRQALLVVSDHSESHRRMRDSLLQERMATIGTLAGGIAHEFNNLTTAISGHAELCLRLPDLGEDARRHLGVILEACGRTSRLARNLLSTVRGERDGSDDRCDLVQAVGNAVELFQVNARAAQVELAWAPPAQASWVAGSQATVGQVVLNLLSNALKAVDGVPGRRIAVSIGGDGANASCAVEDNGCGMTDEARARLFQPFCSSWSTGSGATYRGTGLGLILCQRLVGDAGGSIAVSSRLGIGSTFTVLLPRAEAPIATQTAPPLRPPVGRPDRRVLVVDDEPVIRDLVCEHLRDAGFSVLAAANGRQAIDLLRTTGADIMVLDWRMPVMDGAGVINLLAHEGPWVPVLLCSGNLDEIPAAQPDLVRGRLRKPFHLDELTERIHATLVQGS